MLLIGYGTVAENRSILKNSEGKDRLINLIAIRGHRFPEMVFSRFRCLKVYFSILVADSGKNDSSVFIRNLNLRSRNLFRCGDIFLGNHHRRLLIVWYGIIPFYCSVRFDDKLVLGFIFIVAVNSCRFLKGIGTVFRLFESYRTRRPGHALVVHAAIRTVHSDLHTG